MSIDHENAQKLRHMIQNTESLKLPGPVDTNIVMMDVDEGIGSAAALAGELDSQGVRCLALGHKGFDLSHTLTSQPNRSI